MEDRDMGQRIKMHKRLYRNFNDAKTACDKCAKKEAEICPYLEEIANCHLFKKLEGRQMETLSLRHAS
jgi:hypothetical protein